MSLLITNHPLIFSVVLGQFSVLANLRGLTYIFIFFTCIHCSLMTINNKRGRRGEGLGGVFEKTSEQLLVQVGSIWLRIAALATKFLKGQFVNNKDLKAIEKLEDTANYLSWVCYLQRRVNIIMRARKKQKSLSRTLYSKDFSEVSYLHQNISIAAINLSSQ